MSLVHSSSRIAASSPWQLYHTSLKSTVNNRKTGSWNDDPHAGCNSLHPTTSAHSEMWSIKTDTCSLVSSIRNRLQSSSLNFLHIHKTPQVWVKLCTSQQSVVCRHRVLRSSCSSQHSAQSLLATEAPICCRSTHITKFTLTYFNHESYWTSLQNRNRIFLTFLSLQSEWAVFYVPANTV